MTIHIGFWIWSRGGLRTPATTELASPEHVPIWPPGVRLPPMIILCPGLRPARIGGRTECVPPRKPPFGLIFGLSPQGHPSLDRPPRGGAGSARPQGGHWLHPGMAPLGPGPPLTHVVGMKCLGTRRALHRGRGDRVPPRKSPFASFPGLPRKAILACIAHPAEGRAPHAREEGIGFTRAYRR